MKQTDQNTTVLWVGGSCDYGHAERAGAGAYIAEKGQQQIDKFEVADFGTTEFRMMLTAIAHALENLPENSDIVIKTNVAYIQNFDKTPTEKSANADLISKCIALVKRHKTVSVKIVSYHKSPILVALHEQTHNTMCGLRKKEKPAD